MFCYFEKSPRGAEVTRLTWYPPGALWRCFRVLGIYSKASWPTAHAESCVVGQDMSIVCVCVCVCIYIYIILERVVHVRTEERARLIQSPHNYLLGGARLCSPDVCRAEKVKIPMSSDPDKQSPEAPPVVVLKRSTRWACVKDCGACCYLAPEDRPDLEGKVPFPFMLSILRDLTGLLQCSSAYAQVHECVFRFSLSVVYFTPRRKVSDGRWRHQDTLCVPNSVLIDWSIDR